MDPKLSNLDPKLKEAYDRVMGGPTPPPPPTANPNPDPVAPPPPVVPPPPMPGSSASETVHIGPVGPAVMPPPMPTPTEAVKPYPNQVLHAEKGSKISPLIIGVLVFVFLISYTFLWVRVFNLKIPFLP